MQRKTSRLIALAALAIAGVGFAVQRGFAQHEHAAPDVATPGERKVLYYYDPMHPQYRSDKPGTAPDCGMEMVPMYAEDATQRDVQPGAVQISPFKQQLTGVRTAAVERRSLTHTIRTVAIIEADETKVRKVHTKFPGWVDKLLISSMGQAVQAGQPILSIYSPDLVSTQTEYLLARRGHQQLHSSPFGEAAESSKALLQASRQRLLLWGISAQQIRALEEAGKAETSMTLHSPVSGIVTAKDVYAGLYVTPETELYTVTDLSRMWAVLDVYEYEMAYVQLGAPVRLSLRSRPGEVVTGTVAFIYPYLDSQTRTNKVRVELDNPDLKLKPQMYASAEIEAPKNERLAVPKSAVLDSGTKQIVFVSSGEGFFQPRPVRLGQRGDEFVEVVEGLAEGEQVVVGASFMVDSESQLKAALNAMSGAENGAPGSTPVGHQH